MALNRGLQLSKRARRRFRRPNPCPTILYRDVSFAGGTGGSDAGKFWLDLALAFVGFVLVVGKLPLASRLLVMPWANAELAERKMIARAVLIHILLAFRWKPPDALP
jgi:hypothetical protein